jgi:glutathione synthase/RimK-type ligase-like ATP-grasp enzyme
LGLKIPPTLITNDPQRVREFRDASSAPIIYKVLRGPRGPVKAPPGTSREECVKYAMPMVFTTVLTDEHLEHLDTIRCTPGVFQQYVEKKVELRITVMGKRVFAAEIHSQDNELTKHDWRHCQEEAQVPHIPHQLPQKLETKLVRMLEHLDLQFGAIDMILTPEDEYVFLEINPNGQWLWVDLLTDMPMVETFANMLAEGRPAEPA